MEFDFEVAVVQQLTEHPPGQNSSKHCKEPQEPLASGSAHEDCEHISNVSSSVGQ